MIYICCDENEKEEAYKRVEKKFPLKTITEFLEDATEVIVVGVPDLMMEEEIRFAEREGKRIQYENKEYIQRKIMDMLLTEEEKNLELDVDEYLGIDWE